MSVPQNVRILTAQEISCLRNVDYLIDFEQIALFYHPTSIQADAAAMFARVLLFALITESECIHDIQELIHTDSYANDFYAFNRGEVELEQFCESCLMGQYVPLFEMCSEIIRISIEFGLISQECVFDYLDVRVYEEKICFASTLITMRLFKKLFPNLITEHGDTIVCPKGIAFNPVGVAGEFNGCYELSCMANIKEEHKLLSSTNKNRCNYKPLSKARAICGIKERATLSDGDLEGGMRTKGVYKVGTKDKPLITYVTVVYNRANTLSYCLNSIFSQSYDNIEIIVVDGGSTDGTLDILQENANLIDYFVSQKDSGAYNAMNKGIALARGDLICFMNSDDMCADSNTAACVVELFKQTGADVISGRRNLIRTSRQIISEQGYPRFLLKNCALIYTFMFHQSLYATPAAYERIGYIREEYSIIGDFVWETNSINSGLNIVLTDAVLSSFMMAGASTRRAEQMHSEWCKYICEVFPYISYRDAEKMYYAMKSSSFDYYELNSLNRVARKHFNHSDFKKAYFEAALFTCMRSAIDMQRVIADQNTAKEDYVRWNSTDNDLVVANSINQLAIELERLLRSLSENENYPVEDEKLYLLGKLKHQLNKFRMRYFVAEAKKLKMGQLKSLARRFKYLIISAISCNNFAVCCLVKNEGKLRRF